MPVPPRPGAVIARLLLAGIAAIPPVELADPELPNQRVDIDLLRARHLNVVATAIERIARRDHDSAVTAGRARHGEPADHAVAEQEAVPQPVLPDGIVDDELQILLGEKLTGEEAGTSKASAR